MVRFVSDDIMVMYKGRVVEQGLRDEVFFNPLHPYTKMLLAASKGEYDDKDLDTISGTKSGCPYLSKCQMRSSECETSTPLLTGEGPHKGACLLIG
jgi:oligopeptide/dipeptide ABC transporter ATP-binding protein